MARSLDSLESVSDTSARFTGSFRALPLKIMSSMLEPRSDLALCSPSTQRIASEILDLPQPFGPTKAVTPGSKLTVVLSRNDLKPKSSNFLKYKQHPLEAYASVNSSLT